MGVTRTRECDRARSRLSAALDGESSELEQASARAHIAHCEACAGFERDVIALTSELRAAPLERPSVGLSLPHGRRTVARVLQVGAAAAAVVLAAGLGSLAGSLHSGTATTATIARTGGGNRGAVLDRGIVAMAPGQKLPASRIRPSVAL